MLCEFCGLVCSGRELWFSGFSGFAFDLDLGDLNVCVLFYVEVALGWAFALMFWGRLLYGCCVLITGLVLLGLL